jgi:hypothetical protein
MVPQAQAAVPQSCQRAAERPHPGNQPECILDGIAMIPQMST